MAPSDAEATARTEPHAPALPARSGAVTGLVLGIVTGVVVGTVDALRALSGPFGGSRWLLALCILGLVVPVLALAGTLTGALFARALRVGKGEGFLAGTVRSSIAALPFVAFATNVPLGWIRERWVALAGGPRALAVVALLVIALGVLVVARFAYTVYRRHVERAFGTVWVASALVLSVLAAAAAFWADAVLYQGDYEDFHYGLAGMFVGAVTLAVVLAASLLPSRFTLRTTRVVLAAAAGTLAASLGLVLLAPSSAFSKSNSLLFAKLVGTGRALSDFDGDGEAGLLGGSDCALLDPRVFSGGLEVPENGVDDDCSGKDASWPPGPRPIEKRGIARPWNVLLISIDALRADHLGLYGYDRRTSPTLDRLGARSLVFTSAFSQAPKTTDSVPSIMTGAYPSNVPRDYRSAESKKSGAYALAPDARPLAELFRAAGYATAAGSGFNLNQVERGFDRFEVGNPTKAALEFIEATTVPFFLWLHYPEPHIPYVRQKGHDFGTSAMDRYDGEIAAVDAQIRRVLSALSEHEVAESTIVIVTADHGEEFLEHGGTSHTRKLYRELLHVPLIVHVPGVQPDRIRTVVELVDIVPTLAELTPIAPARGSLDGESLLGSRKRRGEYAYAEDLRAKTGIIAKRALFDGRYRLIDDRVEDRLELYDVRRDAKEQRDLAPKSPDVVSALREKLSVHGLRRHTDSMKTLGAKADARTWAELLPTFRRTEVLDAALERFPKARSPERDAVLEKLLDRPVLNEDVAKKARRLLGR